VRLREVAMRPDGAPLRTTWAIEPERDGFRQEARPPAKSVAMTSTDPANLTSIGGGRVRERCTGAGIGSAE
jgi:hypothetical protein